MSESEPATASQQPRDEPAPATEGAQRDSACSPPLAPSLLEADEAPADDAPSNVGSPHEPPSNHGSNGGPTSQVGEPALSELWPSLQDALARRIQPEQFETWFRRASLVRIDPKVVEIAVQNNFAREWLENYYLETLESAVHAALGVRRKIEVSVDPELTVPPRSLDSLSPAAPTSGTTTAGDTEEGNPIAPTAHRQPDGPPVPVSGSPFANSPGAGRPNVGATQAGSPPHAASADAQSSATGGTGSGLAAPRPGLRPGGGLLWNSDVVLNPKYTFENFVVGPCNRFGHAAAMGAGESPGKSYNPFFLHGRVGVGKTHLLQAVCFTILERWSGARILYLSCETFVNHFISALENGDLTEFRNKYRNVDVLVVDDIHLLANKERTQEEFFHTFNTLYNAGKQIVLSSDSPPKDIPTLQERLVSRFKWGMVTEIEPPCYETRMAIVKRKSRDRGHEVADEIAQLIAEQVDQNVRELEGAVTRLLGYSSLTNQAITPELAREALADLFQVRTGAPSMDNIISVVTEHYAVKLSDLQSKKRTKSIAYPRQVAMFLARKITRHSLEEIGGFFGGRDHSTVLYGVARVSARLQEDEDCRKQIDSLLGRLGSGRTG